MRARKFVIAGAAFFAALGLLFVSVPAQAATAGVPGHWYDVSQ